MDLIQLEDHCGHGRRHAGYVKRVPLSTYRAQRRRRQGPGGDADP